ncbi:50S ribosomal protein L32 [Candidatus Aerophobetes bacterium]|nr:50S ribosomal protein L32 [Candidatus Aerophobetes bacterium]
MGVPKKKVTRARKGNRQAHQKITPPTLSTCPQCGAPRISHFACGVCGYYKGQIIKLSKKKKEKETQKES